MVVFISNLFPVTSSATSSSVQGFMYGPGEQTILQPGNNNNTVTVYNIAHGSTACNSHTSGTNDNYKSSSGSELNVVCGSGGNADTVQSPIFISGQYESLGIVHPYSSFGYITGNWVDHSTLMINDITNNIPGLKYNNPSSINGEYFDSKTDQTMSYSQQGNSNSGGCSSQNYVFFSQSVSSPQLAAPPSTIFKKYNSGWYMSIYVFGGLSHNQGSQNCVQYIVPIDGHKYPNNVNNVIPFTDTVNYGYYFTFASASIITSSDRTTMAFQSNSSSTTPVYLENQSLSSSNPPNNTCPFYITTTGTVSSPMTQGKLMIPSAQTTTPSFGGQTTTNLFKSGWPNNIQHPRGTPIGSAGCFYYSVSISIADPIYNGLPISDSSTGTAGSLGSGSSSSTNGSSSSALSCHTGFNPLNYVLCAIVKGLTDLIVQADNLINSLLNLGVCSGSTSTTPNAIFGQCSNSNSQKYISADYYTAWSSFRDIALGLLVLIGLIVIIAQAIKG